MTLSEIKDKGIKFKVIADRIGMNHTVFSRKVKGSPNNANSVFYFTDAEKDAIRAAVDGIGRDLIDAADSITFD